MGHLLRLPFRVMVFLVGFAAYWMEISADWLVGNRGRTEYVRLGKCKRCGRCCRCLALVMPEGVSKRDWLVRAAGMWHTFAMNFHHISEEDGWLVYRCGYYKEDGDSMNGRCSIYPFRHRLCRFFPRQRLFGYPAVHKDCGFKFVKRSVLENRTIAKKEGRSTFENVLHSRSSPTGGSAPAPMSLPSKNGGANTPRAAGVDACGGRTKGA